MSESYLKDKLYELLGGEDKFSPEYRGDNWSPNAFKWIAFLESKIIVCKHDSEEVSEVDVLPGMAEEGIASALEILEERAFGTLETIIMPQSLFRALGENFNAFLSGYSSRRLYRVGTVDGSVNTLDASLSGVSLLDLSADSGPNIPGYNGKDWWNKFKLLPETYPLDAKLAGYFEAVAQEKNLSPIEGAEDSKETEKDVSSSEEEAFKKKVMKNFAPTVKGVVASIVEEYSKIFSSGYEVLTPYGILAPDEKGIGVALRLSGSKLVKEDYDRTIQNLWKIIQSKMNLTICPNRSVTEISSLITTGFASKEEELSGAKPLTGNLYFPNKMLEYAFGRKKPGLKDKSLNTYPPHASGNSWKKYAKDEVIPSLTHVIQGVVWATLVSEGLEEEYYSDSAFNKVKANVEKVKNVLCTCILVSKHETLRDSPVTLKVRVLDPFGNMPNEINIATEAIVATMTSEGGSLANSATPDTDGIFHEYTHEANHQLANAEPLFAFKALRALKEQGTLPDWNNLILGIDTLDRILRAGEDGIDFSQNLVHAAIAGSRSGKGVWTLGILAAAIKSFKAIFYNDNKPDMGSLLLSLSSSAYVVNGADYTYSPADGTDYFGMFRNRDSKLKQSHIPAYLSEIFPSFKYDDLGSLIYMRSVLFCMSILAARVKNTQWYDQLGGSNGVIMFFDELSNASSQFNTFFTKNIQKHLANTSYAEGNANFQKSLEEYSAELAAYEAGGKTGIRPQKPTPPTATKPSKADYWFTALFESLESSVETLYELSNAGLKNTEAKVSDIFVLAQEIPDPISGLGEKGDLFVKRNKDSTGRAAAPPNPNLLASIAMVGGIDAFLGYNKNYGRILNQGKPGSYASDKLDKNARNFAFVSDFSAAGRAKVVSGDEAFAQSATYFKPFLIFPEGSKKDVNGQETSYFVSNSRSYAEKSGLSWEDVVSRNASEDDDSELDPAIGFKEYLKAMNLSTEEVEKTLNSAGDIAQFVVSKMGYPGSWQDFIHDMRPEWIFSVQDVVNSLDGEPLGSTPTAKLKDFLLVYPDEFPMFSGTASSGTNRDPFYATTESGQDYKDEVITTEAFSGGIFDGFEDERASSQELESPTSDTYRENLESSSQPQAFPKNSFDSSHEPNWTGGPGSTFGQGGEFSSSGEYQGDSAEVFNHWDADATAEPVTPDNATFDGIQGIADVISAVTTAVIRRVPPERIQRITTLGGAMVVNSTPLSIKLPEHFLASAPEQIRRELNNQLLAEYLNWSLLGSCSNLVSLNFDSPELVSSQVLDGLGAGVDGLLPDYGGIPLLFETLPSLNNLRIGSEHYTRNNYKRKLASQEDLSSPSRQIEGSFNGARIQNTVDDFLSRGTRGSFRFTKNSVQRRDYGLARKLLFGAIGLTGATISGTALIGSKTGQGIGRGFKHVFRALGEAVREK